MYVAFEYQLYFSLKSIGYQLWYERSKYTYLGMGEDSDAEGVKHRTEAPWLTQRYNRTRGPGCMDHAYGDKLTVLRTPDEPTPIYDPENPPTAQETAYANLGIAAIILLLLGFLWRPGRSQTTSPS